MADNFFTGLQDQVDAHKKSGGFNPLMAVDAIKRFAGDRLFGSNKALVEEPVPTTDKLANAAAKFSHPSLAAIDAVSTRMGGPTVLEGFRDGTTMSGGVRVPPMPF